MTAIHGGKSGALLEVDKDSLAAHVSDYDIRGNYRGVKNTYVGSVPDSITVPNGTTPFFAIYGSASKTVIVKRIWIAGPILTAVSNLDIGCFKCSTAISGGTSANLTQVPLDSRAQPATLNLLKTYSVAPTSGTEIGPIDFRFILGEPTTPVTGGTTQDAVFVFSDLPETHGVYLRGVAEGVTVRFTTAPGSAVILGVSCLWVEE
jgi:hypothetical protein